MTDPLIARVNELELPCIPQMMKIMDKFTSIPGDILVVIDLPNNQKMVEIIEPPYGNTGNTSEQSGKL